MRLNHFMVMIRRYNIQGEKRKKGVEVRKREIYFCLQSYIPLQKSTLHTSAGNQSWERPRGPRKWLVNNQTKFEPTPFGEQERPAVSYYHFLRLVWRRLAWALPDLSLFSVLSIFLLWIYHVDLFWVSTFKPSKNFK